MSNKCLIQSEPLPLPVCLITVLFSVTFNHKYKIFGVKESGLMYHSTEYIDNIRYNTTCT